MSLACLDYRTTLSRYRSRNIFPPVRIVIEQVVAIWPEYQLNFQNGGRYQQRHEAENRAQPFPVAC